jgi:hypothetical protein
MTTRLISTILNSTSSFRQFKIRKKKPLKKFSSGFSFKILNPKTILDGDPDDLVDLALREWVRAEPDAELALGAGLGVALDAEPAEALDAVVDDCESRHGFGNGVNPLGSNHDHRNEG